MNKDLANIMIMFGHNPVILLAGNSTSKQTEIEGKLTGSVTLSFRQRGNILSSNGGRLTSHLVLAWVVFCSRFRLLICALWDKYCHVK